MRTCNGVIAGFALAIVAAGAQVARAQPYGAPPGYGHAPTVVCESQDGRYAHCRVPWRDARIVQQLSQTACVRGRTWGVDRGGIWVNNGCRARFAAVGYGGWRPPQGWDRRFEVSCGSPQYHYAFCQVDVGRHGRVYVRRGTSQTACIEGRNWGWNRAGIWVDRGCSAVFTVDRRW